MMTRVTCAAVTRGTPNWSTLAVTHISAIPPGAAANTMVATGTEPSSARPHAHNADASIASATDRITKPMNRDEVLKYPRSKLERSEQPIRSCAALDNQPGIAERLTPLRVSAMVTDSGPS